MTKLHLSENEIQQYAIDRSDVDANIAEHIHECEMCRSKLANYQLLFEEIKSIPKPAFDFDLSTLVLKQLPVKKVKFSWGIIFVALLIIISATIFIDLFGRYFINLFKGISTILLCLIITSALCVLIYQCLELFNNYKKQMSKLKFN